MDEKHLNHFNQQIENFNQETELNLKLHIEHEIDEHRSLLPRGLFYGELHEQIASEIDRKMNDFKQHNDLNPSKLYSFLMDQIKNDPTLSKRELNLLAYGYLIRTTHSKVFKKMLKKLERGLR